MAKVRYAGYQRGDRGFDHGFRDTGKRIPRSLRVAPSFVPRRPAAAAPVLRRLRSYIAGTPGITAAGIVEKIDDLLFIEVGP